ncbi:serine/threonine protein kinase [Leptothoe sp. PORK10 BA2]|uniref:serine/threonine protein kinase n=1 Tax=Leptothoe sp. PORK10 BA2 TaxID=3110254 RepID=UPI002B216B0F|nr:serine/threonine-protein kinase [Leptothoe sp. PORK10 BA2]MEA5466716.1 serine/threonine-protein kinase [Leptothoe sp. PORK10 BA2]
MTSPTDSDLRFGLPDFSKHGFKIKSELGANRSGGRVTYLARHIKTRRLVVIKQFQFATSSNWGGYEAMRQEGQVLKSLQHPGIPRYLGVFKSDDGFCMVQEFKRAYSLAKPRSFGPEAIREIAIACLEILVYLQDRIPPVIHRDFKPANILVSKKLKVYLVDFGFARIGDGEVGISSVVKGTLGFMPPEQIFNRQLTEASDLYGLGMTLMCLLTNTPADQVGNLVDVTYQVDFTQLKNDLSPQWIKWLEKMVSPRLNERFANAKVALAHVPDHGLRQPQVLVSKTRIQLTAFNPGDLLTTAITLTNGVPGTMLRGNWQVVPHPSDPIFRTGSRPSDSAITQSAIIQSDGNRHSWINFFPAEFQGNNVTTQIQVDTSQLMTGQTYERTLQLKSNAHQSVHPITLAVETAPMPIIRSRGTPYPLLGGLLLACWITVWLLTSLVPDYDPRLANIGKTLTVFAIFGSGLGWQIASWLLHEAKLNSPVARINLIIGAISVALVAPLCLLLNVATTDVITAVITTGLGMIGGSVVGIISGLTIDRFWQRDFKPKLAIGLSLLTCLMGIGLGLGQGLALSTPWFTFGLIANAIGIGTMLVYLPIQQAQAIALYRRNVEQRLIRP